ncbi:phage tail tape measure protein [Methanohalophilus sp.]
MNSIKIADLYATLQLKGSGELSSALSGTNQKLTGVGTSLQTTAAGSSGMAASMGMAGGAAARLSAVAMPLAAGLTVVGAGMASMVNRTADMSTELMNLNERTGMNVEALQEFKHVSGQAGVEYSQFTKGIEVFNRKLIEVESGTGRTADVLEQMGVSATGADGNMRSMEAMLPEIMTQLDQMEDTTRRNAYASQLFGRNTEAMLPIIAMGADGIKQAKEEAHRLGMVLSGDSVAAADKFNKSIDKMADRVTAAGRSFAMDLYPALNTVMPYIRGMVPVVAKVGGVFKTVASEIFTHVKEKLAPLGDVMKSMWEHFVRFYNKFTVVYNSKLRPIFQKMGYEVEQMSMISKHYFDQFRVSMEDFKAESKTTADAYVADVARMEAAGSGDIPSWAGHSGYIQTRLESTGLSNISQLRDQKKQKVQQAGEEIQGKALEQQKQFNKQVLQKATEINKSIKSLSERVHNSDRPGGPFPPYEVQVQY